MVNFYQIFYFEITYKHYSSINNNKTKTNVLPIYWLIIYKLHQCNITNNTTNLVKYKEKIGTIFRIRVNKRDP